MELQFYNENLSQENFKKKQTNLKTIAKTLKFLKRVEHPWNSVFTENRGRNPRKVVSGRTMN